MTDKYLIFAIVVGLVWVGYQDKWRLGYVVLIILSIAMFKGQQDQMKKLCAATINDPARCEEIVK